ncbi:conserved hypothetical protein [Leishmania major strain Friedlin]|uniref:Uncharacterized protein n=1 Tax=Leishmania major TaxID=5664 RepID=Q4Q0U2_LEIMA|nr:conserved hypothetical protein [Leishmania major strain Friedlin]CAG9584019.1 WD_domain_-_G-beta_repeat_-_putative [Leishmania major strain Friedlin]CAJ09442.1 conserved hypothetical protein [Leishmania major strain Friedlin]|eukprot:XP_001687056.1 conserved hypothetical protein [Leishmania major strain Friedlin]
MELDHLKEDVLMGDTNEVTVPAAIVASAPVLDMGFHPRLPIMAAGLVTGEVEIYKRKSVDEMVKIPLQNDFSSWIFSGQYREDEVVMNYHHQNMLMHPSGSVSSMEFTDDGNYLVSASGDRTISVMDCVSLRLVIHIPDEEVHARTAGKKKLNSMNKTNDPTAKSGKATRQKAAAAPRGSRRGPTAPLNPHKYGISALNVCDENLIATGDDDGLIAVWDMRERRPVYVYHEHGDYVSQLCYFTDAQELVSSSGDTCLGVYDMRAGKVRDFSVRRKDELNCFAFINSSGVSNATFIPSIVCGTPHGGLPLWKYGSWARPYDVMDRHPAECEAIISFHGENTSFNHNLILTGACDGLVRVLQMYPVRRNLCQLSARDYTYSHSSALGNQSSSGGPQQQGNYVARRARGQEAISRMRVSHDANLLAVSGSDNIIDFVDIAFMNDEAELDQLRGRAEQHHLRTLRELDRELEEEEKRERRLLEGCGADGEGGKNDVDEASSDPSSSDASSPSSEDSDTDVEMEADAQARLASREVLRQRFAEIGIAPRKRVHFDGNSDDDDDGGAPAAKKKSSQKAPQRSDVRGQKTAKSTESAAASTRSPSADTGAPLPPKASRRVESGMSGTDTACNQEPLKKKRQAPVETSALSATMAATDAANANPSSVAASCVEAVESMDSMEVYRTERQQKRERAAAARWLKEERRKKINFTYEKRRRRVGGFFGDMVSRDDHGG